MLENDEAEQALTLSEDIVSDLDATCYDRLLRLKLAYRFKLPEYAGLLQNLQDESRDSPESALQLIIWLESHGMALVAAEWAKTLPKETAADPRVRLVLAECHMQLGDWETVKALISGTGWGKNKFIALALESRVLRQENVQTKSKSLWDAAVMEASKLQEHLVELEKIAESWNWEPEAEAIMWMLIESPEPPDWVFIDLQNRLFAEGNTESLRKLWQRKRALDPSDKVSANNLSLISLLRGETTDAAHDMAAAVYYSDKTNPAFISTYAFSLYRQSKPKDALNLMNSLTPEQLKEPSTAVAYVAILIANHAKDQAREILPQIKSSNLLPEERRLLDRFRIALGQPNS